jgi:hypothetical protein
VTRATLTQTQQVNGTLGYGAPVTVNGPGSGKITWLPAAGAVIGRGQPVYRADDRPVSLRVVIAQGTTLGLAPLAALGA